MRTTLTLFCVLLVCVTADIHIDNVLHEDSGKSWTEIKNVKEQRNGNQYQGKVEKTLSTGHKIVMDYSYSHVSHVAQLDELPELSPYSCTHDVLTVKTTSPPKFEDGWFLVGSSSKWGCVDERGTPHYPIFEVLDVKYDSSTQLATVSVRDAEPHELMNPGSRFHVDIEPGAPSRTAPEIHHSDEATPVILSANGQKRSVQKAPESPISEQKAPLSTTKVSFLPAIHFECENCYFDLSVGLKADYDIGWFKLKEAWISSKASLNARFVPTITIQSQVTIEKTLFKKDFRTIVFWAGILPLAFTPNIEIILGMKYAAGPAFAITTGFEIPQRRWERGVKYKSGQGMTTYSSTEPDVGSFLNFVSPTIQIEYTNMDFAVYVKVEPGVAFQKFANFIVQFKFSLLFNFNKYSEGCWKLSPSWDISAACGLDEIKYSKWTFFNGKKFPVGSLASGSFPQTSCISFSSGKRALSDISQLPGTSSGQILADGRWVAGAWSSCSAPCSGGVQTRTVVCMAGNKTVDNSWCSGQDPLHIKQTCNDFPCNPCKEFSECAVCQESMACHWCSADKSCKHVSANCSDNQETALCSLKPKLEITKLSRDSVSGEVSVSWQGAPGQGVLFFVEVPFASIGGGGDRWFVQTPVTSSSSSPIRWTPKGLPAGTYNISLVLPTDDDVFISQSFTLESNVSGTTLIATLWSECSSYCGDGGNKTRSFQCLQDGSIVPLDQCVGENVPHLVESCHDEECPAYPLQIESPRQGFLVVAGQVLPVKWSGAPKNSRMRISLIPRLEPTHRIVIAFTPNNGQWDCPIPSDLTVGYYYLTTEALYGDLLTPTSFQSEVLIEVQANIKSSLRMVVKEVKPVEFTLHGASGSKAIKVTPTASDHSFTQEFLSIGRVAKVVPTDSNLVALSITTEDTSSVFGFQGNQESLECSTLKTCEGCSQMQTCGWCESSSSCLPTGKKQPSIGHCERGWYSAASGACPVVTLSPEEQASITTRNLNQQVTTLRVIVGVLAALTVLVIIGAIFLIKRASSQSQDGNYSKM